MSSHEAPNASERQKEMIVTTILDGLLASATFDLTLEPFAGNLEPSVWVKLPPDATLEDLDEVLDYVGGCVDRIASEERWWSVETSPWGLHRGFVALVVPKDDLPRAMLKLCRTFPHWRKTGDIAEAIDQIRALRRGSAQRTVSR
jgi:hypothetical protein